MRVAYTRKSREDLTHIWQHYAEDASVSVADEMIGRIRASIGKSIARFPTSGRVRPELGPAIRSKPVVPYVVLYKLGSRGVRIVRVLHGRRDIHQPIMSILVAV